MENALERLQREEKETEKEIEQHARHQAKLLARLDRVRKLKKFQESREHELLRQDALTLDELDAATEGYDDLGPEVPVTTSSLSPSFWDSLGIAPAPQTPELGPGS